MRLTLRTLFILAFSWSAVAAQTTPPLRLSLDDAIQRGLKNNLGVLERETTSRITRAERMRALSELLPTVTGSVSENVQQNNIAVFGFRFPGIPQIIGPFGYSDARASAEIKLLDWAARRNAQAAAQNVRASDLSVQDGRDLVVQAVANAYLTILADAARVEATRAEVATAQALYERARDQHAAGVSPAIDELRAQVELKARQQQLLANQNQFAKGKLNLSQAIGLPASQPYELADAAPYSPLEGLTPEQSVERAHQSRADYQSAVAQLRAAEVSRQAAVAERYPTLSMNGNYGLDGINFAQSHGTFVFAGAVKFNIFDGGRIRADVAQSDAVIQQRKDEIADLERRIEVEVRSALLDLQSAADQVAVSESNLDLAGQALTQARDRFAAGVTDNIEVVQAQDALANAQETVISSRYAHNLAKVSLARAVGTTETSLKQYMGGRP
jgi:outer membrane protein TolC